MDGGTDAVIPGLPGLVAVRMFEARSDFIPSELLSLGGPILAARWNHRFLLDVDLFCGPNIYGAPSVSGLACLGGAIKAISGFGHSLPEVCRQLGVGRSTLYRNLHADG